ncbi:LysR substrate-binding domain-containing protein [Candidatus Berkiella aquae]|nr:LysR family transcriptional regulator [Candidatus Berkiella aquae]MCS5710188.1 LysR family transcriptional regulator [Candidatus Berkiella aquae]
MNKLECIATLITVIEENGFSAAARKLKLSTPAISRQITALENDLGITLLKRTTRQIALTDPGLRYYEECKQIIHALQLTETALKSSQQQASGQLHILSNRYFADKFLIPRLPDFMQQHPLLTIKIQLAERFPDFRKEDVDLAFGISMEGPPDLIRRQVDLTRYVLCASPGYLQKYGTPQNPKELIKHHYITHTMRQPDNMIMLDNHQEILVKPILWLDDSRAMCDAAISGIGLVRLHDYVVQDALACGQLQEILPEYHQQTVPVYLYYEKSRFLLPKIRRFIDYYTAHP